MWTFTVFSVKYVNTAQSRNLFLFISEAVFMFVFMSESNNLGFFAFSDQSIWHEHNRNSVCIILTKFNFL